MTLIFVSSAVHAGTVSVFFSHKMDLVINAATVKGILTSKFVQKNLRLGIIIPDENNQNVESFTDYNWRELNKLWRIRFFTGRALMPLLLKETNDALSMIKSDNNTVIVVFGEVSRPTPNSEYRFISLNTEL